MPVTPATRSQAKLCAPPEAGENWPFGKKLPPIFAPKAGTRLDGTEYFCAGRPTVSGGAIDPTGLTSERFSTVSNAWNSTGSNV